jgi:AraC-like DNA-binding protein
MWDSFTAPLYVEPVMTVSARPVNDPAGSAIALVDMRSGGWVPAGSFTYRGRELVTGWHRHDLHQIEYALEGVVEVETCTGHFLLPPQQAAWIPAGLPHQTTIKTAVTSLSVFFDPSLVPNAGQRARILAVPHLLREMIVYAERWPVHVGEADPAAKTFFEALANLVAESLDDEFPLSLPVSRDPIVMHAAAYTREHLCEVTVRDVSSAVGISERTLRRRMEAELAMSWREYLVRARLLRAMALLAQPGASVLQVALSVGFDNASAFSRSFVRLCGETPSVYRRRARGGAPST